jgi:hypothetical protein
MSKLIMKKEIIITVYTDYHFNIISFIENHI